MSDINIPPFHIGQRVIRIEDSVDPSIMRKGQECVVENIWWCCAKNGWRMSLGVPHTDHISGIACDACEKKLPDSEGWMAIYYRAAEENQEFQAITYTKVMELESGLVNMN